jgi:hypothetical protein
MCGVTRTAPRYWTTGTEYTQVYYAYVHRHSDPRLTLPEGHPRTISVCEDHLLQAIRDFFNAHIFGPDRKQLLAASLPGSVADDQARRDSQAAALRRKLRHIDTAENAQAREIETLAHLDNPHAPALIALRSRIVARFAELEDERATITKQLADLDKTARQADDPSLLDQLPMLGDILADDVSPRLHQQLYQAFDLQLLYKKTCTRSPSTSPSPTAHPAPSPPSSPPPKTSPAPAPPPSQTPA